MYGNFYYENKTVVRPSYLYYGNPYIDKITSWYWDGPQVSILQTITWQIFLRFRLDMLSLCAISQQSIHLQLIHLKCRKCYECCEIKTARIPSHHYSLQVLHYSNVTRGPWRLKSPVTQLLVRQTTQSKSSALLDLCEGTHRGRPTMQMPYPYHT